MPRRARIAALFIAIAGLSGFARAQAAKDVKVVNTPSVHVVNVPSVSVNNTPTVVVANSPSVNVANTPSVTVTNSALQPAVTVNRDDPGRIPFQSVVNMNCSGNSCSWLVGFPSPGHRIVVQHVSGLLNFQTQPADVLVLLKRQNSLPISSFFAPAPPLLLLSAFDQPVEAFFSDGQIIEVQVILTNGTFKAGALNINEITISGYELDCSSAACEPIQPKG